MRQPSRKRREWGPGTGDKEGNKQRREPGTGNREPAMGNREPHGDGPDGGYASRALMA